MRRPIVCITPVKNESWVLDLFLRSASGWADHIIIADQQSADNTRDIATSFANVDVFDNPDREYNESNYRSILYERLRSTTREAIIVSIDADELLTPAAAHFVRQLAEADSPPGKAYKLPWINIHESMDRYWTTLKFPVIYVDDGASLEGKLIHSDRIPKAEQALEVEDPNAGLIHLQYLNLHRFNSKQRWYQAFEKLRHPHRRPVWIYRSYHHYDQLKKDDFSQLPLHWIPLRQEGMEALNKLKEVRDNPLWWDRGVLNWMIEHGPDYFRKIDLWDVDWNQLMHKIMPETKSADLTDPRTAFDKRIFHYLKTTQPYHNKKKIKWQDKALKWAGW